MGLAGLLYPRFDKREIIYALLVAIISGFIGWRMMRQRRRRRWLLAPVSTAAALLLAFAAPITAGPLMRVLSVPEFFGEFEFTPHGNLLLARVHDAVEIDPRNGAVLRSYQVCAVPESSYPSRFIDVSHDDTCFAVSGGADDEVDLIDRASGALITHVKQPQGTVPHVQFSSDSTQLVISLNDRFDGATKKWSLSDQCGLTFYDARSGARLRHVPIEHVGLSHFDALHWVRPDVLAVGDARSPTKGWMFRIFNPQNDTETRRMTGGFNDRHTCIRVSPDGKRVAFAEEGVVKMASLETGETNVDLTPADDKSAIGDVTSIAFSPDGKCVVCVWAHGVVSVHEVSTCRLLALDHISPSALFNNSVRVRFDPTGQFFVVGIGPGELWFFRTPAL